MSEVAKHKRCPFCGGAGGMSYYKMAPREEIAFGKILLPKCDGHWWHSVVCGLRQHNSRSLYPRCRMGSMG